MDRDELSDFVRIIVEAETTPTKRLNLDIDLFKREVANNLQQHSRLFKSYFRGLPRSVPEDSNGMPPSEHFDVAVESADWAEAFFPLTRTFLQQSKRYTERYNAWSLMQIAHPSFLRREFQPANRFVSLDEVSFGNMRTPFEFTNHYSFHESESDLKLLTDYYNKMNCEPQLRTAMTVDFHHDQGDFFVKFGVKEHEKSFRKSKVVHSYTAECVYMLKVVYSKIRRIIVDFDDFDENNVMGAKLYFLLNNPVEIRRSTKGVSRRDGKEYFRYDSNGERYVTWNKDEKVKVTVADCLNFRLHFKTINREIFYNTLSRLRFRCNLILEFSAVDVAAFAGHVSRPLDHIADHETKRLLTEVNCYGLNYLIEALCSRGAVVNDQFLASEERRHRFVTRIVNAFKADRLITLATLERMLNTVDENLEVRNIEKLFCICLEQENRRGDETKETERIRENDGFLRVRKVVLTPTRTLFVVPEMIMGNKFLREFDPEGELTLRVTYRDDSGMRLNASVTSDRLIDRLVDETVEMGIVVAGKKFMMIGGSNSQMRDHGAYYVDCSNGDHRERMKEHVGVFENEKDPIKANARFGQRFTQARAVKLNLYRNDYAIIPDTKGGQDENGDPYTFSDGVGSISVKHAKYIAKELNLENFCPSVYQIRYRGMKGIVTLNPNIDYFRDFQKKYGFYEKSKHHRFNVELVFRKSQDKFKSRQDPDLDIVKYSTPTPMQLNRPMINIMDQVTGMQKEASHKRLVARVHQLLDIQLKELGKSLTDEHKARERLSEIPRRIDIQMLTTDKGFYLTEEPFFRSLLQCNVQYTLKRLRAKNQVAIPFNQGRMMFGVIDETGGLQHGQIFCQITNNLFLKTPGATAGKTILKGPLLMTKNPQNVSGDMRMFNAVDIPELHHLVDVVVFPRYGPRPHPDQMAGSDLDGDEYALMWDPELFFDRNEEPIEFPKPKKTQPDPTKTALYHVKEHMKNYIKLDSIGAISYAFLVCSDLYGIESEVCQRIARKHSMAVDFPKNGVPPVKLTNKPDDDGTPAEKPDRYPDFMEKDHEPAYVSANLNGQLYRRSKDIESILISSIDRQDNKMAEADPELMVDGWRKYESEALEAMDKYNAAFRAILDNYGVSDEAQLFTGSITAQRNRLSDKDTDDMSMFNTNYAIEQRVSTIFHKAREEFFNACGGYMSLTVSEFSHRRTAPRLNDKEFERRTCKEVTVEMKKRASAYYQVCYNRPIKKESRRILSFPWVAYDVLAEIKKQNYYRNLKGQIDLRMETPLLMRLDRYVCEYSGHEDYKQFEEDLAADEVLQRYITVYPGLSKALFLLDKFGSEQKLFDDVLIPEHLFYLLILFATENSRQFFEKIPSDVDIGTLEPCDLHERIGGLGRLMMEFFEFLSTREFRERQMISFEELDVNMCLQREALPSLSRAASYIFYRITFSGSFLCLPQLYGEGESTSKEQLSAEGVRLYEIDPFVIEVPPEAQDPAFLEDLRVNMQRKSGLHHLVLRITRVDRNTKQIRVLISGVGTLEARENLRELVAIKPNLRSGGSSIVSKAALMADMVYSKVMGREKTGSAAKNFFENPDQIKKLEQTSN